MRVFISRKNHSPFGREHPSSVPGASVADGSCRQATAISAIGRGASRRRQATASPPTSFWWRPLDRAVALAQKEDVPVRICEHLRLDMAGVLEVPLDVHGVVGEVGRAFASGRLERAPSLVRFRTTFRPLPPPPAEALRASGHPSSPPMRTSCSTDCRGSVVPGTIGTPAARIRSRAAIFEPIASIASGGGPIQAIPASVTSRAKDAFSARKP
jgi:hypothetical protein